MSLHLSLSSRAFQRMAEEELRCWHVWGKPVPNGFCHACTDGRSKAQKELERRRAQEVTA